MNSIQSMITYFRLPVHVNQRSISNHALLSLVNTNNEMPGKLDLPIQPWPKLGEDLTFWPWFVMIIHVELCFVSLKSHNNGAYNYRLEYFKRKIIPKLHLNIRRGGESLTEFDEIVHLIQIELLLKPDRSITDMLFRLKVMHGCNVRREMVRQIMRTLDPVGVFQRKGNKLKRRQYFSKGPNWIWHIADQYDKLSPYGIFISGCIDGFSRYVLWCKAGISNKNPAKIAGYFLSTVEHVKGTENMTVATMQNFLREDDEDSFSKKAFIFGKSTHNQELERDGHFTIGDIVHTTLIQYCYMDIIRRELDDVTYAWNCHRIRSQKHGDIVPGIPDLLYNVPEMLGNPDCRNYIHAMDTNSDGFHFLRSQCCFGNDLDEDTKSTLDAICDKYHVKSVFEAKSLYILLKNALEARLYH
uniref:Uncharacterized protein LOC111101612 isoform X6 n=1 Tax=Crassostrea virginica TaxID=6565 RepID=A0A8B8AIN0_CRAVI|nr:uncharacterized protein LOC111101612 isoform X6 [Crassostrea virginica]